MTSLFFGGRKQWSPQQLHCYVTGGSQGLGLALAIQLIKEGANVSVVARNEVKLKSALQAMEAARISAEQKLNVYSHDLSKADGAKAAIEAVCYPYGGRAPDAVFMCAGAAKPLYFVEAQESDFHDQLDTIYFTALWTSWAATKLMASQKVMGKLVFVSSTLGLMTFVGYSPYAPMKHALRGLADTLRSELLLYGIDVHIFFPNGMLTPGYEEENKTKPKVTLKIEETDEAVAPDVAAATLLKGLKKGHMHITNDFATDLFRATTRGAAPYHNALYDAILGTIGWIGIPIWRWGADKEVIRHRAEHEDYLRRKGFFKPAA